METVRELPTEEQVRMSIDEAGKLYAAPTPA